MRSIFPELAPGDPTAWFRAAALKAGAAPRVVDDPLRADFAGALHDALLRTPFARHHHPHYPLHIAPLGRLEGALAAFTGWLRTADAAHTHALLLDDDGRGLRCVQVQVSRMRVGERFPPHEDTHDEGVAAVYNLSRGARGGALVFTGGPRVAPRFNRLTVFRPRGLPHEVTEVRAGARYSVTAFYLRA